MAMMSLCIMTRNTTKACGGTEARLHKCVVRFAPSAASVPGKSPPPPRYFSIVGWMDPTDRVDVLEKPTIYKHYWYSNPDS
jgi:hypothetical protein